MAQTLRVANLTGAVTLQALRVADLVVTTTALQFQTLRVADIVATVTASPAVAPITIAPVHSFDKVNIQALPANAGNVPTSYTFRVVDDGGTGVTLVSTAADKVYFIAPAYLNGGTVTIGIVGHKAGLDSAEMQFGVGVGPHSRWRILADHTHQAIGPRVAL